MIAILILLSIGIYGQVTLPHIRTVWNSTPPGWTDSSTNNYQTSFACSGNNGAKFEFSGDQKIVYLDSAPDKLSFVVKSNSATTSTLLVEKSDDGIAYTTVINLSGSGDLPTTCTTKGPYSLSSTTRYIRWSFTKGSSNLTMDDVSITKSTSPTITVSAALTNLNYNYNAGPSTSQSFTVGGTNLTGNLTVTAPTDFEISTSSGGTYSNSLSLTAVSGTVTSTNLYARLQTGKSVNTYTGDISVSGGGASTKTISVSGAVLGVISYANLQSPANGNIPEGGSFDIYGRVYAEGVTNVGSPGAGITAQIGYSTTNTDPSTWTNWVGATFNGDYGNDDEYKATLSALAPTTYYYATRFKFGSGTDWKYGGYSASGGGFWNGSTNISGVLTINSNVIFGGELIPDTAEISEGQNTSLEVEFYEAGLTDSPGKGLPAPTVEIAVSTLNSDPSTWSSWQTATYNRDNGNNDVYGLSTGSALNPAIYYYAGRVKKNGAASYKYIGKNFTEWSSGNGNGILTVKSLIDFGNYQSPGSGSFTLGNIYDVFGQVYVPGITPGPGQGGTITAQVGYSTSDTDPKGAGWTWVAAQYNSAVELGNNDEYMHNIGADITSAGTYYLAFRYRKDAKSWYYGGYSTAGGGEWNGTTNKNAVVNVIATSSSSDIIATPGFTSPVNIPYADYQAADIIADGNSVEVAKFTIRDGGSSLNDADAAGTKLTSLKISVSNFANIRRIALYDGNTEIAGTEKNASASVTFGGLSLIAPDNGTKDFSIRVSFKTLVTDNQQIQFTVTEALGSATAFSKFAATNAGGATSSIAGDDNRVEVTADRLVFTTQPVNGVINVNLPTIVVKAQDVNTNLDLDAGNSINLTTSGTGISANNPYLLTAGVLNISNILYSAEQTGITLTATTTGLAFDNAVTSTPFNITAYALLNGDVRPAYAGSNFSYNSGWEQYDGTTWTLRTLSLQASKPTGRILIDKAGIGGGGSATNTYLNDIIIYTGGELLLDDLQPDYDYDSWPYFLAINKNILIKNGGKLTIEGDIKLGTNTLTVESGGELIMNNPYLGNDHPFWGGTESFQEGSFVTIEDWDRIGTESYTSLLNTEGVGISSNPGGYLFGNLFVDGGLVDNWVLVGGQSFLNLKLCQNNLEIYNDSPYFITGTSNNTSGFIINGDFIIYDGAFNFSTTFNSTISYANNFTVNGNFICETDDSLKLHSVLGRPSTPTGTVTIKGDVIIGDAVTISNDGNKMISVESGTEALPKFIDIGSNIVKTNIDIKNGYRRLKRDLILGTNTRVTVKTSATLDFGFDNNNLGSTPLVIRRFNNDNTQNNQAFSLDSGGLLTITSPQGITNYGDYNGNVQVGASDLNRVFAAAATYKYIGKENQSSGNGLPDGPAAKKIIVKLNDNGYTFQPNGLKKINSAGYLEIIQGIVLDNATGSFEDASTSNFGELRMSGGRYRLFKTGINPGLSGVYNLTDGVIEFANTNLTTQTVRNKSYLNVEVTGKPVGNSNGNITILDNGTFKVMNGGEFTINANSIVGTSGNQTVTVENGGLFRTGDEDGFSGNNQTSIQPSIENIILDNGSTVEYSRAGMQTITAFNPLAPDESSTATAGYYNLKITGDNGNLATATAKTIESATPVYIRNTIEVAPQARLMIEADKTLIVKSNIINNGGAARNLIVKSDGNLKQIDDTVMNTTPIAVRRIHTLTPLRKQYNFISSPVANQNMKLIFGDVLTNVPFVTVLNEMTNKFVNASTADYGIPARGFSVREPKDSYNGVDLGAALLNIAADEAEYKGSPNNGLISLPLPRTHLDGGYNVVGNPYPSNLDIIDLYNNSVNDLDISADFKFWDNSINDIYTQMGTAYQGYSYAVFNVTTGPNGTGTAAPGRASLPGDPAGARVPTRVVKVSQALMVRALKAGASLKFKNTMRRTTATPFFGKDSPDNYYRLEFMTPDSLVIQNAVSYFAGGNAGIGIEDSKIPNATASDAIFNLVEDEKLIINGNPLFTSDHVINIGTRNSKVGTYQIRAIDQSGLFANGQSIYLKDKQLGILTDISTEPYVFTNESGEFTNRFEIVYKPEIVLATGGSTAKATIQVYRNAQDFVVQSSVKKITSYELYDMSGRMIMSQKTNAKEIRFNAERLVDGAYVLKTQLEDGQQFMKKLRK